MTTKDREITLKLKVQSVEPAGTDGSNVTMWADYNDDRNKDWSPWTPSAQLQMTVRNEYVEEILKPGANFLVTLTLED